MAQIKGREEQLNALKEVRAHLASIDKINAFIQNMDRAKEGFTISYCLEPKTVEEENVEAEEVKTKGRKKAPKKEEYSALCEFEDLNFLRKQILKSKIAIKDEIYSLAVKFNIELDEQEEKLVNLYCEEI